MIAIAALALSAALSNGVNDTASAVHPALASAELSSAVRGSSNAQGRADGGSSVPNARIGGASSFAVHAKGEQTAGATATAAARLLDQASFGPTSADILHVEQVGLPAYIKEQIAQPQTVLPEFPMDVGDPCDSTETCWGAVFWKASINDSDQLRQRVAFALSHIFVTTTPVVGGYAMVPYYNLLIKDAFSNWRNVMQDVALSSVMGNMLNMVNSAAAPAGQIANENFARENMQLFNLGDVLLNNDGSVQTDSAGRPLPSYTEDQVQAFARAFTGWTYASRWGQTLNDFQADPLDVSTYTMPMVPIEHLHDTSSKTLLNGTTLPAGETAEQDLSAALDNVFQHPNVPPFISRQLIQQLVSSNPSPAYISRIAQVFMDNGSGVRGDLKAVVTAILLDPEARAGDTDPAFDGGHLREPILYLANVMRALPYYPWDSVDPWGYWTVSWTSSSAGEAPMQAPSVFYYYSPNHMIPGTTLYGPEFGLENAATISSRKVMADQLIYGQVVNMSVNLVGDTDLTSRAANPSDLVDELSFLFMHSQMPAQMKQIIVDTITPTQDLMQRIRVALNLVITSPQYKIIH